MTQKRYSFYRTCAIFSSHSGGFYSASSKTRPFSNRRHSPNSCGQFFISLMNFITDLSSHPYPAAIIDTSLLMRNGPIAHSPPVSYTHLRAHETRHDLVCRLLLEKKKKKK